MSIGVKLRRHSLGLCLAASIVCLPRIAVAQVPDTADTRGNERQYDEPFVVSYKDRAKIPRKFRRQEVSYRTAHQPGTLVIDTAHRFLYLVLGRGRAVRYGIGVGREGFAWAGVAEVARKAPWPQWIPPKEMVARDPFAAKWAAGMPGGPKNPLGARALYLYSDGVDTLYRIHGTNQPSTIGHAVSSGCVRLLNADVVDLYNRVNPGTKVVVMGASSETTALAHKHSSNVALRRAANTLGTSPMTSAVKPKIMRKNNFNLTQSEQVSQ